MMRGTSKSTWHLQAFKQLSGIPRLRLRRHGIKQKRWEKWVTLAGQHAEIARKVALPQIGPMTGFGTVAHPTDSQVRLGDMGHLTRLVFYRIFARGTRRLARCPMLSLVASTNPIFQPIISSQHRGDGWSARKRCYLVVNRRPGSVNLPTWWECPDGKSVWEQIARSAAPSSGLYWNHSLCSWTSGQPSSPSKKAYKRRPPAPLFLPSSSSSIIYQNQTCLSTS
jgi:hypothetical protein